MITEAELLPGKPLYLHAFGDVIEITVVAVVLVKSEWMLEFTLKSSAFVRQRPLSELGVAEHSDPSMRPRLFRSREAAEQSILSFLNETSLL